MSDLLRAFFNARMTPDDSSSEHDLPGVQIIGDSVTQGDEP
ncbi:MAG: hypothetical protein Q8M07_05675 [Prosthecobacter sp.]|nr:hypothetical protein [Prosthecobacter sp.]